MHSMIRTTAKICIAAAALVAALPAAQSYAENLAYVSADGSGNACTAAQPCSTITMAWAFISPPLRIICLNGDAPDPGVVDLNGGNLSVDIDCPLGYIQHIGTTSFAVNSTMRLRHLGFRGGVQFLMAPNHIVILGSGTLILEDCTFEDGQDAALDIEPNGPLNVVIKNSRISNNGAGILFKPGAGGSIKATLDHVTITGNTNGGIKSDSTNGVVNLDVSDSEISNNGGNGLNAVAGTNQNIIAIKNSVIARNGGAGVLANGANAGVLMSATLLDQNVAGATSVVNGGNLFTYSDNDVIGPVGSGYTSTATPQ